MDPATGRQSEKAYEDTSRGEIDTLVRSADDSFEIFSKVSRIDRAVFLRTLADALDDLGRDIMDATNRETALGLTRLQGEMKRTCGQFRSFADFIEEGSYLEAVIDRGDPDRFPSPKPDLRRILRPVGPVAVLGASNFPYAFGIVGGDTASALAAGCPVVAKGHPSHPETSEILAGSVKTAIRESGLPEGVFSLVQGDGNEAGISLVSHPLIKAGAFTGSRSGGMALYRLASSREEPIPFYSEMGSVNPVVVTTNAMMDDPVSLGIRIAGAVLHGSGQLCTKPGLVFVEESPVLPDLLLAMAEKITKSSCKPLLNDRIRENLRGKIESIENIEDIELRQGYVDNDAGIYFNSIMVTTTSDVFRRESALHDELFGPVIVVVRCRNRDDLLDTLGCLEGQLTGSIFTGNGTDDDVNAILEILQRKTGRVIMNGVPIGVEVTHSMQHGGPFPATTAPWTTSVGMMAIKRWLRPVVYQDLEERYLPDELKDNNPSGIMRIVDGEFSRGSLKR
jgi:NADP-dependent aldehyde dehydrogenase